MVYEGREKRKKEGESSPSFLLPLLVLVRRASARDCDRAAGECAEAEFDTTHTTTNAPGRDYRYAHSRYGWRHLLLRPLGDGQAARNVLSRPGFGRPACARTPPEKEQEPHVRGAESHAGNGYGAHDG